MSKRREKSLPKTNRVARTIPQSGNWLAHPFTLSAVLFVVTLAVFWPVVGYNYVNCDDPEYFFSNPHVRYGFSWDQVKWAFGTVYFGNWLPMTWLSHMLDGQIFGTGTAGPHFVNLLLHATNTVLAFGLLRQLTGALWRSVFVAGLFALHPLHVESVAWVAERRDVLCACFGLLSLIFYARYAQGQASGNGREAMVASPAPAHGRAPLAYGLSLFFFALGLMSKAMVVTLPCVMLLLDWWPLRRISNLKSQISNLRRLVWEKIPFFAMSAALSAITFYAQQKAGAVPSLEQLTLGGRLANALVSYARYLGKTIWPVNLALPYPHPGQWPAGAVLAAAALVAVLVVAALWLGRRHPFVPTGWFWFFGMLIPAIGLIQTGPQAMADRFTYLPLIGLFLILAWGAGELFRRWRLPVGAIAGLMAAILVACALRTRDQLGHWKDSETLFRHAIAVTQRNYPAHNGLGVELFTRGRLDEALEQYHLALAIQPAHGQTLNNLGNLLVRQGRFAEAIPCFERALPGNSSPQEVHNNLANALAGSGRLDEAIGQFQQALRLQPDFADAHNNLGNALAMKGRLEEAVAHYRDAIRYHPDLASAHGNLGYALTLQGRFAEAIPHFERALRINPGDPTVHLNLGRTLAHLGRRNEAVSQLREALRLRPEAADARRELRALGVQVPE